MYFWHGAAGDWLETTSGCTSSSTPAATEPRTRGRGRGHKPCPGSELEPLIHNEVFAGSCGSAMTSHGKPCYGHDASGDMRWCWSNKGGCGARGITLTTPILVLASMMSAARGPAMDMLHQGVGRPGSLCQCACAWHDAVARDVLGTRTLRGTRTSTCRPAGPDLLPNDSKELRSLPQDLQEFWGQC